MAAYIKLPEEDIISKYQQGLSLRYLSEIYNVDKSVIKNRLIKNGIVLRTLSEANRIYEVNEDIFSVIDSHTKAYWLGFIASDGSIYRGSLKLGLSFKDYDHVYKFRNFMGSNHPIKEYTVELNGKQYKSCELRISSLKIINSLSKFGIIPNKSFNLIPANIQSKYINSYILGIIDGDGCFYVDKKNQIKLNVINSYEICQFIVDSFVQNCGIKSTKIIKDNRSKIYYCYFGGNLKLKKITDFLYKDVDCFLTRKFEIVKNHYRWYVNQPHNKLIS